MELELENNKSIPSEKVRDVMEKMPSWVVRQGLLIIFGLLLLALFFSWIIKYPEVLISEINITTTIPSLKVVTQTSGTLHLLQAEPNMQVEKDQYLAVLDNSADIDDVIQLKQELNTFKQASEAERIHNEFFNRRGDMPAGVATVSERTATPWVAVLAVAVAIAVLVALGDIALTWSLSAFAVLIYYALTNLAAIRLDPEQRLFPIWVAYGGLGSCLFLAFWVETRAWLIGGALLACGLLWRVAWRALSGRS